MNTEAAAPSSGNVSDSLPTGLPVGVRDLLVTRIDSFEKLELVVALHRSPRSTLTVPELAAAMNVSSTVVRQAASELRAGALVEITTGGEIQLIPPTTRESDAVDELVRMYSEDRFLLVKAIGEIAMGRIRNMAARAFADAFVLRKKPPGSDNDG